MNTRKLSQAAVVAFVLAWTLPTALHANSNEYQSPDSDVIVPPVQSSYQLGSGDQIKVTIFGHPDLSGQFSIDGSGRVSLPLIKDVQAEGLSVTALEEAIVAKLSPDYLLNPKVSIEVLNYRPIYIIGEVKNPGRYAYVSGMTVLTAVALAGGYTYRAKTTKAFITHSKHISDNKETVVQDTVVLPGDVIEIPEKYWLF